MMFRCPVCREPLQRQEKQYRCKSGHSFDIARSGYVNLLLDNGRGRHGDDKDGGGPQRVFRKRLLSAAL